MLDASKLWFKEAGGELLSSIIPKTTIGMDEPQHSGCCPI